MGRKPMIRECRACGALLVRREGEPAGSYRTRRYCNDNCRHPHDLPCGWCGGPILPRPQEPAGKFARRRYCSRPCASHAPHARRARCPHFHPNSHAEGRLDDVEHLIDAGESPIQVARRLGLKPTSLGRWLDRWDQHDLARTFYRAERLEKRAAA